MSSFGTPPPSSDELQLRQLLTLPAEKRPAVSEKFAGLLWRLLVAQESYVQRRASRWVRAHEAEDVAADVILKAAEDLKEQFLNPAGRRKRNGKSKLTWDPDTTLFVTWFQNFCGNPFKQKRSGAITNAIRQIWRTSRHASYDPHQDSNRADDTTPDPEQELIEAEDTRTENIHLKRLQPELGRMDRDRPRTSFMVRLSYGVHKFQQLDAQALIALAKELRLSKAEVALVREVAKGFAFEPSQKSLSNDQIGCLTGISESGVRYQLSIARRSLLAAINNP